MGPAERELTSSSRDGDRSLVDAIAWFVLLFSVVLIAPFLVVVTVTSVELLLGFGLFDPAIGGDPVLLQHLPAVHPPLVFGAGLAALALLWIAARMRLKPMRRWGAALLIAYGLLLGTPFLLLSVVNGTAEPGFFYKVSGPVTGDHPALAPVAGLCRGLLVPAALFLLVGIASFLRIWHRPRVHVAKED